MISSIGSQIQTYSTTRSSNMANVSSAGGATKTADLVNSAEYKARDKSSVSSVREVFLSQIEDLATTNKETEQLLED